MGIARRLLVGLALALAAVPVAAGGIKPERRSPLVPGAPGDSF
ncbi:MAG TPA: hypothetical protein VLC47_11810 [Burkholderiales bacterium]|nr:hypothetical protein [Burkholderiales bacterium]